MPDSFNLGEFHVRPQLGVISANGGEIHLEPKVMEVLVCLAGQAGEVVPKEQLLQTVWADTFVSEHVLKVTVSELRKALGDDAKDPRFIQTIPKQGYRLIAQVSSAEEKHVSQTAPPSPASRKKPIYAAAAAFLLLLAAITIWKLSDRAVRFSTAPLSERIKSVAVLPLRNLSENLAEDYFADGMTEAITSDLARTEAVKVISPASARRYNNTDRTVSEVARELGVDAVIEGSVLRSANQVRIIVQLIDGATGEHLWNEKYERNLGDVLALQDDLASDVARQISLQLNPKFKRRRAVKLEAYEAYLKGRFFWNKGDQEGLLKSADYFQQALEHEPRYAEAYAGLADAYNYLGFSGYALPNEVFPKAKEAALRAIEADAELSEAHAALAFNLMYGTWEWVAAEAAYQRAIKLDPARAINYHWMASLYAATGRHPAAVRAAEQAQALDPVSPNVNSDLGWYYYYARRFDDAIRQSRKTLEIAPDASSPKVCLQLSFHFKGEAQQSVAEFEQRLAQQDFARLSRESVRRGYQKEGEKGVWRLIVGKLEENGRRGKPRTYQLAIGHALFGNPDRALFWIEQAVEKREAWVPFLASDPCFESLQPTLSFQSLLNRLGIRK